MNISYFEFKYEPDNILWRYDEDQGLPTRGTMNANRVRVRLEAGGKVYGFRQVLPQFDSLGDSEIDYFCRYAADSFKAAVKKAREDQQ